MSFILSEEQLIDRLKNSKKVLLLEPNYKRRYIPLGLDKISSFVKSHGGEVFYSRGVCPKKVDLICVSTIFTTDLNIVIRQINQCRNSIFLRNTPIVVGGIAATLMPDYIFEKTKTYIFKGISKILDDQIPDYSFDYGVSEKTKNILNIFTTRGCPNKCKFCVVSKIEPNCYIVPSWKKQIEFTDKKTIIIEDNNILGFSIDHLKDVVSFLNHTDKNIAFEGGVDCRLINDDNIPLITSLNYARGGFRTAFDTMEDDNHYQIAMDKILKHGFRYKIAADRFYTYILFSFNDTPQEALYRCKEAWKFGSRPYPMQFRPLNQIKKTIFVGKYWTLKLVKAFREYMHCFGYSKNNGSFEQFIKHNTKYKLNKEDWDKFYFKR